MNKPPGLGSAGVVTGREAELAQIEAFLDRVEAGPIGLVLSGDAGIGKSELWLAAVRRAEARGHRVLRARPAEPERDLPLAALRDLLQAVFPEIAGDLPAPQREGLEAALLLRRVDEPVDPRTLATGLASALSLLAAQGSLVLAIDDVQWVDPASRRALEFALRRPPVRLGVLLAERGGGRRVPLGLDAAFGRHAVQHLPIGPLSPQAIRSVILGAGFDQSHSMSIRLADASGGNPFFALELARALEGRDPRAGEPLPVPPALADLVRGRVAGLSTAASLLATTVAAMFRPTQAALDAALGSGLEVAAALEEAERAAVLAWDGDRLRFTHPLIGSALYGALSVTRRRALHRQLAATSQDPEERARHLVGGTVGQDEVAAADIELAAALAERRGAADAAAELYQVAERFTPRVDVDARARRSLAAANALVTVGDFPGARALAQAARAITSSGRLRARAFLLEASLATYTGTEAEQSEALDAALSESGDDDALRLEILLARAGKIAFDPIGSAGFAEEAVQLARETGDTGALAQGLMHLVLASGLLGLGDRWDLFDEAAALEAAAPSFGVDSLIWCHWIDDADGARERHATQLRLAQDRGDAFGAAELAEFAAMVEFRAGHWDVAERALEDACDTFAPFGITGPVIASFADRSVIDAHRGRLDRARRTLRDILDSEPSPDPFWAAVCLSALGVVEFVAGDLRATDAAWTTMREHIRSIGWLDFLEDRSEPDHVEALMALGDLDRARELLEHLEWRGRTLPRPWIDAALPRARALVAAAHGQLDEALATIPSAAPSSGFPFEDARLSMVRGQLERRAGRKLAARHSFEESLAAFERLGSPPWIERAGKEITRLGLRHRDRHELTAMERRIAELAASGLTNRQVAGMAFVSPKTVEANLARVYSKLGIRSRAELGAHMGAVPPVVNAQPSTET